MSGHAPWHSLTAEDSNCISLNCSFTRFTQTSSHIHQPSDCPHSSTALHSTPCPGTFPTAQAGRNITPSHPNAHSNFFLFSEKKDLEGQRQMPDHETIPAASEAEAPPCTHTHTAQTAPRDAETSALPAPSPQHHRGREHSPRCSDVSLAPNSRPPLSFCDPAQSPGSPEGHGRPQGTWLCCAAALSTALACSFTRRAQWTRHHVCHGGKDYSVPTAMHLCLMVFP